MTEGQTVADAFLRDNFKRAEPGDDPGDESDPWDEFLWLNQEKLAEMVAWAERRAAAGEGG